MTMSDSKKNEDKKRNLPSWMKNNPQHKHTSTSKSTDISNPMEGVVFVLSGFVNPERADLRSQAIEMGAQYRPDWTSDCTLLVCAYPNTPKFRQVQADCGTIIRKEWISECYRQKKLVDIEEYIMHAGKPWRKSNNSAGELTSAGESHDDQKVSSSRKSEKHDTKGKSSKPVTSSLMKGKARDTGKELFSPSKVKKWATDDLNRTISWLESQEEKPDPGEIEHVAAEGIVICLQDFIESLEQKQDVQKVTEQWNIIPHAIEELMKLEESVKGSTPLPNEELCKHAKVCKQIYEAELRGSKNDSKPKNKKLKADESEKGGRRRTNSSNAANYDSDETVEMTEEEIEHAYNNVVASKTQ